MPGMRGEGGSRHGQREKVSGPLVGSAASMARVGADLLLAEVVSLPRTPVLRFRPSPLAPLTFVLVEAHIPWKLGNV